MRHICLLIFFISIFAACKKDKKDNIEKDKETESTVLMISPAKNEVCAVGTESYNNLTSISFNWKPFKDETAYRLYIKDLSTNQENRYVIYDTSHTLTLNNNTTYSWYVVGINSENGPMEGWKFHLGSSTITYAPRPATAYYPKQGGIAYYYASGIDLIWMAYETDIRCDVYFGTSKNPPLIKENLTKPDFNGFSINVTVEKGKTYYWKIVSKNAFGNQAISPLFQFNVIGLP